MIRIPATCGRRAVGSAGRAVLLGLGLGLGLGSAALAQGLGEPPDLGISARHLRSQDRLPPLRDRADPGSDAEPLAGFARLQVGRRAQSLQLTIESAQRAWTNADATLARARERLHTLPPSLRGHARSFRGRRASELNALLRDPRVRAVRVVGPRLEVDESVRVERSGVLLDLGSTELRALGRGPPQFLLQVRDVAGATVVGGAFRAGRWAVLVSGGRDVTLRDGRYDGLERGGVVLENTLGAVLSRARMTRLGGAGVLLHGDTRGAAILDNDISGSRGSSNWNAAVVLTDRTGDVAVDPDAILEPDRYWARPQPIPERLRGPRQNVVAFNRLALNASSGLYLDGAVENVVLDNRIEGNSKEGLCLDNGATANVVAWNVVRQNGRRWGKSDADLRLDFVAAAGRLPDGSAAAKTPGISIDNAAYNIVYANRVERNHGGGVKMVRTAYFNLVGLNLLIDNNEGAGPAFHYFGIELGAAPADAPAPDLDFTPSRGNIVYGNTVRGSHYAGIYYAAGSVANDTFDNSIFGATHWSMEQVHPQANPSLNNLTNLPARNIDPGIAPRPPK